MEPPIGNLVCGVHHHTLGKQMCTHLVPRGPNLLKAPGGQQEVDVVLEGVKGRVAGHVVGSIKVGTKAASQVESRAGHAALTENLGG